MLQVNWSVLGGGAQIFLKVGEYFIGSGAVHASRERVVRESQKPGEGESLRAHAEQVAICENILEEIKTCLLAQTAASHPLRASIQD